LPEVAGGADNIVRPLTAEDLGLHPDEVFQLRGTLMVTGTAATALIDLIEGSITSPFTVLSKLTSVAKTYGATSLRIQATLANERLYRILVRRYRLSTENGTDYIEISIP
jgi:hypothetical protein